MSRQVLFLLTEAKTDPTTPLLDFNTVVDYEVDMGSTDTPQILYRFQRIRYVRSEEVKGYRRWIAYVTKSYQP